MCLVIHTEAACRALWLLSTTWKPPAARTQPRTFRHASPAPGRPRHASKQLCSSRSHGRSVSPCPDGRRWACSIFCGRKGQRADRAASQHRWGLRQRHWRRECSACRRGAGRGWYRWLGASAAASSMLAVAASTSALQELLLTQHRLSPACPAHSQRRAAAGAAAARARAAAAPPTLPLCTLCSLECPCTVAPCLDQSSTSQTTPWAAKSLGSR